MFYKNNQNLFTLNKFWLKYQYIFFLLLNIDRGDINKSN